MVQQHITKQPPIGYWLKHTDAGIAEQEVIFKLQTEVRRRAMQGITDQEYATIIAVLQRMVNNLE